MTCNKHKQNPEQGCSPCAGCEIQRLKARIAELEAGINELLDSGQFYLSALEFDYRVDGEKLGTKLKALAGRKEE